MEVVNRRRLTWPAFIGLAVLLGIVQFQISRSRHAADSRAARLKKPDDSFTMKRGVGSDADSSPEVALGPLSDSAKQAEYEAMLRMPAATLLERWLVAARTNGDAEMRELVLDAFVTVFAHSELLANARMTEKLAGALQEDQIPVELRVELAFALGQTEAVPAYRALMQVALASGLEADLRLAVLQSIASATGGRREDVIFPEDIGPVLESGLQAARYTGDTAMAAASASALARLGTPSGVRAAFELYFDESFRKKDPASAAVLEDALTSGIRNPAAVPFLSALLTTNSLTAGAAVEGWRAEMLEIAGAALIDLGTPDSAQGVLEWIRTAPDEAAPVVNAWFANMRTPELQAAVQQYLTDGAFQSEAVKTALEQALERSRTAIVP